MIPEEQCTNMGERVLEVLHTKHPDARPPSAACLDAYPGKPPEMVPVNITDNVVSAVAGRLLGGAGPGGTYLISLQHWPLWFGAASGELWLIVAEVGEWLSNGRPPWAAYRAYTDRSDSWTLVQCNQPARHQGAIGGPGGPPVAQPLAAPNRRGQCWRLIK